MCYWNKRVRSLCTNNYVIYCDQVSGRLVLPRPSPGSTLSILRLINTVMSIINNNNNNNSTYLYSALFTLCSNALLKKTVIPLLNTHRSYTEKMKVFSRFLNIVMESALWIFRGSSFHNLAAEVPKRRFPNRMDLFLYGTSDVNAVDRKDLLGM